MKAWLIFPRRSPRLGRRSAPRPPLRPCERLEPRRLFAIDPFPFIESITLVGPTTTRAESIAWNVAFSEPVSGVDASDFALGITGSVVAESLTVTGSGTDYTVLATGVAGAGSLQPRLVDDGSIRDTTGNPLTKHNAAADFPVGNPAFQQLRWNSKPMSIALADLDGDGKSEVVAANTGTDSISISRSDARGRFVFTDYLAVGEAPLTVAVGDIDGDLKADVVAANHDSGTLSILRGANIFQTQPQLEVGLFPSSVVIRDVNRDGAADLIAANSGSDTLSVLLNNPWNGSFQPQRVFAAGDVPTCVVSGDVNGDGTPDLVTANYGSDSLSLLLGRGDGTFEPQLQIAVGPRPVSAVICDVNGDGKPDLVSANVAGRTLSVLLGNGDGTFQTERAVEAGGRPESLAVGDFNLDGKVDLVTMNTSSATMSILLAEADGTFSDPRTYAVNGAFVVVDDFNRDGMPDVVVAAPSIDAFGAVLGDGRGGFQARQVFGIGSGPMAAALADFTGDGRPDLVASPTYGSELILLSGSTGGGFRPAQPIAGTSRGYLAAGDVNLDGRPDIVAVPNVILSNGDGTFQPPLPFEVGLYPEDVAIADVNKDDNPDLIVANSGSDSVGILLGNGDGTFQPQQTLPADGTPVAVDAGDFNRDGNLDLVAAHYAAGTLSVRLGDGAGAFGPSQTITVGSLPRSVAVGDLNGDGNPDLVSCSLEPNALDLIFGRGDGSFHPRQTLAAAGTPLRVAVCDVNGDARADIVTFADTGTTILIGAGDGTFRPEQTVFTGFNVDFAAVGDIDGDGRVDLFGGVRDAVSVIPNRLNGNFSGDVVTLIPRTPPAEPLNLVATPGNGGASLSWTAPSDTGGSAITDYVVEVSADAGATWRVYDQDVSPATTTSVTGLANFTPHVFRVAAVNAVGRGSFSVPSQAVPFTNRRPTAIGISSSSVAENLPAGSVIGSLSTTDPDADDLFSYELVPTVGDGGCELIGTDLRTTESFDFERGSALTVRVRSTDGGGLSIERTFSITVTDVNEPPTAVSLTPSTTSLPENSSTAGGRRLADITVVDDALGTNLLGLSGPDAARFQVVGHGLFLREGVVLDHEAQRVFSLFVSAGDVTIPGAVAVSTPFTLSITDIAEPQAAPQLTLPAALEVVEDTVTPLVFLASPLMDTDSAPSKPVTVRLAVPAGTIAATTTDDVAVGGTPTSRTLSGSIAAINAFLTASPPRISYTPVADSSVPQTLKVTVTETYGTIQLSSSRTIELQGRAVNDAPVVTAPAGFLVTEDVRSVLVWPALGNPFMDVDSSTLVVTLSVVDGVIAGATAPGVAVGGTNTARMFSGTTGALNAYFRQPGRIAYTTAPDNNAPRTLTISVSDGLVSTKVLTTITIIPVNDAPSIRASATLPGGPANAPVELTHETLRSALGATDRDSAAPTLLIQGVNGGTLQRWTGTAWVGMPTRPDAPFAQRRLAPGQKLRWLPPRNATGLRAAFRVRAWDGQFFTAQTAQVLVKVQG